MGDLGFGILAPGGIAAAFARDLSLVPGARLVAVGSRDRDRAERFAATYGGRPCGSYEELLADPEVEVVYVASPNAMHLAHATLALEAGKHVVCEKPLTTDRDSSERLIDLARAHDRFLLEGLWSACHPVWQDLAAALSAGDLGVPARLSAAFCFDAAVGREHRLRNPALGGGALLDLGCYPLTFAHLLLGEAESLLATGVTDVGTGDEPGVDLDVDIEGIYPGGVSATLAVSVTQDRPVTASLVTDQGVVEVPARFHHPAGFVFHPTGGDPVEHAPSRPVIGVGYGNEIAEVVRCVDAGLRESPLVPWDRTLTIMGQLDDLRGQLVAGAGAEWPAGPEVPA